MLSNKKNHRGITRVHAGKKRSYFVLMESDQKEGIEGRRRLPSDSLIFDVQFSAILAAMLALQSSQRVPGSPSPTIGQW